MSTATETSTTNTVSTVTSYVSGHIGVPGLEKLRGQENYENWQFGMKMALLEYGLWDCVVGTDTDPSRGQRAFSKIYFSIDTPCQLRVRACKDGKQAWDELAKAYKSTSILRKFSLKKQLYKSSLEDYSSMSDYIGGVLDLVHQLSELEVAVDDGEVGHLLLCGLPESHAQVVNGFCSVNEAICKDKVINLLKDIESRTAFRSEDNASSVAFVTSQKSKKFVPTCHNCNQKGHIRPKCPKLAAESNLNSNSNSNSNSTSSNSSHRSQGGAGRGRKFGKTAALIVQTPGASGTTGTNLFTASHALALTSLDPDEFYTDTCASDHVSLRKDWMVDFDDKVSTSFRTADNGTLSCGGMGKIPIKLVNSHTGVTEPATVREVKYSPSAAANLLSVYQMAKNGHVLIFNENGFDAYDTNSVEITGNVKFTGTQTGGIYKLDRPADVCNRNVSNAVNFPTSFVCNNTKSSKAVTADLIHRRSGHMSYKGLARLSELVDGIGISKDQVLEPEHPCVACLEGKQTRKSFSRKFKKPPRRATCKLERIHCDLVGPMKEVSLGGAKWALMFTDDFTRKSFVYFLKTKEMEEVFSKFVEFKALVENQCGVTIKKFRSDNGSEFVNRLFKGLFKKCGIYHEKTVTYTPEQDGVQERANRTGFEKSMCMLAESGLPLSYWAEALNTAVYLKNRSPTAALKDSVPEELWTGERVDLSHLRVFGCLAYNHVPKKLRTKLDLKSKPMIMVGYSETHRNYRLIDPTKPKEHLYDHSVAFFENVMFSKKDLVFPQVRSNVFDLTLTRGDIITMENVVINSESGSVSMSESGGSVPGDSSSSPSISSDESYTDTEMERIEGDTNDSDSSSISNSNNNNSDSDSSVSSVSDSVSEGPLSRPTRSRAPPTYLKDYEVNLKSMFLTINEKSLSSEQFLAIFLTITGDPISVEQALGGPAASLWQKAMDQEFNQLKENDVFELVDRPVNSNIVKCKWVFKVKEGSNGKNDLYKARLVAKGYSQQHGLDYNETFAPVARLESIRLLLALSVELDLEVEHLDVKAAFLNSELDETIFMEQPQGYPKCEGKVWRLKRAIYGLKQASRAWNLKVERVLVEAGYVQARYDKCVYVKKDGKMLSILALYVDDFLLACNNSKEKKRILKILNSEFKIKRLGEVSNFLGVNVTRDKSKGTMSLSQSVYINKLMSQFGLQDANLKNFDSPMAQNIDWHDVEPCKDNCKHSYRTLVGALMYLAVCTRPDIAHSVAVLCQFNDCHGASHWEAAKRVLKYLSCTKNLAIVYKKTGEDAVLHSSVKIYNRSKDVFEGVLYADADWAGDSKDRISYSGYIFVFAGSVIGWQSHKQKSVGTSSRNAEFVAINDSVRELLFVKGLLSEIVGVDKPIVLYSDSQSAIKSINKGSLDHKNKHIEVRFHEVMQEAKAGNVIMRYKCSEDMLADVLTKSLGKVKHAELVKGLGIVDLGR